LNFRNITTNARYCYTLPRNLQILEQIAHHASLSLYTERESSLSAQRLQTHWRTCGSSRCQCRSSSFFQSCTISSRVIVKLRVGQIQKLQLTPSRETAAEENATSYYPILDRVAEGYFDDKTTEQALYTAFVDLLHSDGHITQPEALASFDLALSIRSAAPRIEAHYQFYKTSVEPSLAAEQTKDCDIWASFHGKQYCSVHLDEQFGAIESERYVQMIYCMDEC
jgi:hypothetical protein